MAKTSVISEIQGNRWVLRMEPPPGKPPTLDLDVLDELQEHLREIDRRIQETDPGETVPQVVLLESASPAYFCVGANVAVLETLTENSMEAWVSRGNAVLDQLEDLPLPVIAKVRGYALGGGLELAMACDLIYCDNSARLGQSEANLGFIPGWGGCFRLPRRVGIATAKRLFYSGEVLSAESALALGLVDEVAAETQLDSLVDEFAASVSTKGVVAIRSFKRIVNAAERNAREANGLAERRYSLDCITNSDTQRRVADFLNKRK